ncbi:MAG: carboxymuconolactone decarboxylase family protein [Elusimicrobia bacterium]|nr:carboxymuconolactone decarboxylase family protein [Elusimicrobiota bacterium]
MREKVCIAAVILAAALFALVYKCNGANEMQDLKNTDPELSALWGGFVDNEVKTHGSLDAKTRYLVLLAGNAAAQGKEEYKLILKEALSAGVGPVEIKEVLYQAVPYAGMAKIYDFILITNEIFKEKGIKLPLEGQSTVNGQTRLAKGLDAQRGIFGAEHIDSMRAAAPKELKHIQDYLSANCFGDYYTRGGLDIKTRELITFVVLISIGGADAQAKAHAGGNINVGNGREILLDAVTQLLPYIGYPRSLNAISAINSVNKK